MSYLTTEYVDSRITEATRRGAFTDREGRYRKDQFDEVCADATALVYNTIKCAGYSPPDPATLTTWLASSDFCESSCARMIRSATFAVWVDLALGTRKQAIGTIQRELQVGYSVLEGIREGTSVPACLKSDGASSGLGDASACAIACIPDDARSTCGVELDYHGNCGKCGTKSSGGVFSYSV